jgi:hypothetical protein
MRAERVLLAMIVATAIFVIPSVLTSPVLAQTGTETEGNQGTTGGAADDESPSDMYEEFQTCLESAAGGAVGFATEDEIRDCFIDAGYTGGGDGNEDEDNNDEEENEDDDEETNN